MPVDVEFRDGVIWISPPAAVDEGVARDMHADVLRIIDEIRGGRPTPVVVNQESVKNVSSKARKALSEMTGHDGISRVAFIGGTAFIRTVSNFIFRMSGKAHKMRLFTVEADAAAWARGHEQAEDVE